MKDFLFDDFNEVSAKEWKQRIQYDLKGADYNDTEVWQSAEGIHVKPFYHQDDFEGKFTPIPGQPKTWSIAQDVFVDDAVIANSLAVDALNRGAEIVIFKAEKPFELKQLFNKFPFSNNSLIFDFSFLDEEFLSRLKGYLIDNKANFRIQLDPIGQLLKTGNWFANQKSDMAAVETVLKTDTTALSVNVATVQNAGASIVQQLAYALA